MDMNGFSSQRQAYEWCEAIASGPCSVIVAQHGYGYIESLNRPEIPMLWYEEHFILPMLDAHGHLVTEEPKSL